MNRQFLTWLLFKAILSCALVAFAFNPINDAQAGSMPSDREIAKLLMRPLILNETIGSGEVMKSFPDWSQYPCWMVLIAAESYWIKAQEYYAAADALEDSTLPGAQEAAAIYEEYGDYYTEASEDARGAYDAGDCEGDNSPDGSGL